MNVSKIFYPILGISSAMAIAFGSNNFPANGVQTRDGTVAFESGISLVDTYTTFKGVRVRQAKYYFDLELPENLGEPLKKLVIRQRTGGDDIKFEPENTEAYLGDHRNRNEQIGATAIVDEAMEEITVEFEEPIAPGNRVTVSLRPRSNPDFGGVYLFGVTAFPEGEKARGLYIGSGRFHFFENRR